MVLGALFGAIAKFAPTISKSIGTLASTFVPQTPTPVAQAEQRVANQTAQTGGLSKGQMLSLGIGGVAAAGLAAFAGRKQIAAGVRRVRGRFRRGRAPRRGRRSF